MSDWTSSAAVADRASAGDAALATVVDEHVADEPRVRACAGMTMVLGACDVQPREPGGAGR